MSAMVLTENDRQQIILASLCNKEDIGKVKEKYLINQVRSIPSSTVCHRFDSMTAKMKIKEIEVSPHFRLITSKCESAYMLGFMEKVDEQMHKCTTHDVLSKAAKTSVLLYKSTNGELAVKFKNSRERAIFIEKLGGIKTYPSGDYNAGKQCPFISTYSSDTIYICSYTAKNGELAAAFPSDEMRDKFIDLLSLTSDHALTYPGNPNKLYINDRRIHDTAHRVNIPIEVDFLGSDHVGTFSVHHHPTEVLDEKEQFVASHSLVSGQISIFSNEFLTAIAKLHKVIHYSADRLMKGDRQYPLNIKLAIESIKYGVDFKPAFVKLHTCGYQSRHLPEDFSEHDKYDCLKKLLLSDKFREIVAYYDGKLDVTTRNTLHKFLNQDTLFLKKDLERGAASAHKFGGTFSP